MQRSTALQGGTVTQAQGNAPRIPCYTMEKFVSDAMQRSTALQGGTVTQAQGNAPRIPCYTMEKFVSDAMQKSTASPLLRRDKVRS